MNVLLFLLDRMAKQGKIPFLKAEVLTGFFLHIIGAVMAFVILQKIAGVVKWRENKVFRALAEYSMPMYLFHQQIIYFVIIWLNGSMNPYIHATINFIVAIAGSFAISCVLMKFKVTRFLIGEK